MTFKAEAVPYFLYQKKGRSGKEKGGKCSADAKRNYREYSRTSIRLGKLRRFCVWGCDRTKNTI